MDGRRFDDLTRNLARPATRRGIFRTALGLAAGLALRDGASAATCRAPGNTCREGAMCCSGLCEKVNGRQVCVCPAGTEECGGGCRNRKSGYLTDPKNCGACGQNCPRTRCQLGVCDGGICRLVPDPAAVGRTCDDGDACTVQDVCRKDGSCKGEPLNCDDGLACTDNACESGRCVATVKSGYCAIGGACVEAGTREPGKPCRVCDLSKATNGWSNLPKGTTCDDTTLCNGSEACDGNGTCVAGVAVVCRPPQGCEEAGVCDPSTGLCSYALKAKDTVCRNAGTQCQDKALCDGEKPDCPANPIAVDRPCNDGSLCTTGETCQPDGTCGGGTIKTCQEATDCAEWKCNHQTGECARIRQPNGVACTDDGDGCTKNTCQNGECTATPITCTNGGICRNGECGPSCLGPYDPCAPEGEIIPCCDGRVCIPGRGGLCDSYYQCISEKGGPCLGGSDCECGWYGGVCVNNICVDCVEDGGRCESGLSNECCGGFSGCVNKVCVYRPD